MDIKRVPTKEMTIGTVKIGGDNPVLIQSMTNTNTRNAEETLAQINALVAEGCEIVRVAVPDMQAAAALKEIKAHRIVPLVADIHFDYRLALKAIENGVDKLRINPGNIGDRERIRQVVEAAAVKNIPIRIGVNGGSLEKELLEKYGGPTPEAMVESGLKHAKLVTDLGYHNIALSLKASSVQATVKAYELASEQCDYPLHLGVTEAGTEYAGSIKSAVGIGALLLKGIGDTIRVSLTSDPINEVRCAKEILKCLGLRKFGIEFVSCPTCGRTEIDLIPLARMVEESCKNIDKNIKVAVMGCIVNGPGEARDADIGIAGGKGVGLIFKKGEILCKVSEAELGSRLIEEIHKL